MVVQSSMNYSCISSLISATISLHSVYVLDYSTTHPSIGYEMNSNGEGGPGGSYLSLMRPDLMFLSHVFYECFQLSDVVAVHVVGKRKAVSTTPSKLRQVYAIEKENGVRQSKYTS